MNIEKLIKNYFAFALLVMGAALFNQTPWNEGYLTSLFHTEGDIFEEVSDVAELPILQEFEGNFQIINDPGQTLTAPGEKDKEIMQFILNADKDNLLLKDLKLKIEGIHALGIEGATLVADGKIISKGKRYQGYLVFSGINYKVGNGQNKAISVRLDLSAYAQPSTRIRLDIENPKDIVLLADGEEVMIAEEYPVKGKYLSVARKR